MPGAGLRKQGKAGVVGPSLKSVSLLLVPYKYEEMGTGQWGEGRIVGLTTYTHRKKEPHPPKSTPAPPQKVSVNYLQEVGWGRAKPQKLKSKHPEMLGGRGAGQQVDPRRGSPARPAPLPLGMKCLSQGWGPSLLKPHAHTHTHTHTHTPTCIHTPDAQGCPQTHTV